MTHLISWQTRAGKPAQATLLTSAFSARLPARVEAIDDTVSADIAFRKASEGCALVWEGDFHNARQLFSAMTRRLDARKAQRSAKASTSRSGAVEDGMRDDDPRARAARFHAYRMAQSNRARVLGMLWVVLEPGWLIASNRAPDVAQACEQAFGTSNGRHLISLRELLGVIGAAQWREKGVVVPELGPDATIKPWYGVFSPVRGEYLQLVQKAPLDHVNCAWDIGTGTGVIAAILARRGVQRVVATDTLAPALACARENVARLQLQAQVEVVHADMFPEGQADLIVCNPPWLPAKPTSTIELALYDADSQMLTAYLRGLRDRLTPTGEGWLILSDLAERLGLREQNFLQDRVAQCGLEVVAQLPCRPAHPKSLDANDPLAQARTAEITSLWRLAARTA